MPANGRVAAREELLGVVRSIPELSALSDGAARSLLRTALLHEFGVHEMVPPGRRVHLVLEGSVTVVRPGDGTVVERFGSGDLIDPRTLDGQRRQLRAVARTRLLSLRPAVFDQVVALSPSTTEAFARARADRHRWRMLAASLREVFPELDPEAITTLAADASMVHVLAGESLCRQDDPADGCYLVVRGRLRVIREADGGSTTICDRGPGAILGENTLLEDGVRNATLVAVRDTDVAVLDRPWLDRLLAAGPGVSTRLIGRLLDRATVPVSEREQVIALVPVTPTVELPRLVDRLLPTLERCGTAVAVASADADRALASPGVAQAPNGDQGGVDLQSWLDDLEESSSLLLLVADATPTPWTRRCLRQADRVVLVADAAAEPVPGDLEAALATDLSRAAHSRRTLVLLHGDRVERPSGTAVWLDAREVDDHYHVRPARDADMARLARSLAGRPIGLVCSGGGARAIAEAGAYRALRERGVPIDVVSGASIGAVMAATIALHDDPEQALGLAREGLTDIKDFTLPIVSLLRGEKIRRRLDTLVGETHIEDLWLPFVCVSTDLTEGSLVQHTRGSLRHALRSSVALPGVLPPTDLDGRVLVDGGVLDNLPVAPLRELEPSAHVIAIDVAPPRGPTAREEIPFSLSGWRLLLGRVLPRSRRPKLPALSRVIVQSSLVSATRQRQDLLASEAIDLYLDLNLHGHGLLEFEALDRIAEAGYRQSTARIDAWLAETDDLVLDPVVEQPADDRPMPLPAHPSFVPPPRTLGTLHGALFLATRDLRFRARRFAAAIVSTAVVLALLLLLTGLAAQFHREPELAVATLEASHWVVPIGTESPFTSTSTFSARAADAVAGPRAAPVLVVRQRLDVDGVATDIVVIGHGEDLGTPVVATGATAAGPGEVAVADALGMGIGQEVSLGGRPLSITGIVPDATVLAGMPLVYLPLAEAQELTAGGRNVATAVLVDGHPETVPDDLHVVEADVVAADARRPLEQPISTIRLVQVLLAAVAAMIIAAVTYLSALDRQRDVAVLRAMGTPGSALAFGVAAQGLALALVAGLLGDGLQVLLAPLFPLAVHVTAADVVVLPVIAAAIAAIASYGAIRRTLRIDPADAFSAPGA